jgi:beta-glucosidase
VVVLQTGSPVVMEKWIREVPAVLQAWYGGQEGGRAIADVLFGKYNPSGRLPFTIGWKQNNYPAFNGYQNPNLIADYSEGIFVGYRYFDKEGIKPLFSFGHGLSYSIIGIGKLQLRRSPGTNNYFATVEMTNMGDIKGSEVLQLYIHPMESKIRRPEKELKRFKRVTLEPGERIVVKIPFDRNDFANYNEVLRKWQIEPGLYEVTIGTSADNIKLRKRLEIK